MTNPQLFRPAAPPQTDRWPSLLDMVVGDTAKNPLVGWPSEIFDRLNRKSRFLHLTYHGISDPEGIRHVFLDNVANYHKPRITRASLEPALGDGLLTAEGESWRDQRRLMAPVFTPAAIASFLPLFARTAEHTADRWAAAGTGRIDVAAWSTRSTFEIIDAVLFSGEAGLSFEETSVHLEAILGAAGEYRLGFLFGMPWLDRSALQKRGALGRKVVLGQLSQFIARRQADPAPSQDFMTRLLSAFAERYPPQEAARLALNNAVTFFAAGHDTTANGLAWALYLLSEAPDVQDRARQEALSAWDAGGGPDAVLTRLPYLKMVWEETLRLYPPVPRLDRQAMADDEICGVRVKKGDQVSIWPWVTHRHRKLWREPELFNPENFSPQAKEGRHRFQYIPFGAGPHVCIGAAFAQAEALILLSRWLARFRFQPAPGHTVFPHAHVTLKPIGGMPLMVEAVA